MYKKRSKFLFPDMMTFQRNLSSLLRQEATSDDYIRVTRALTQPQSGFLRGNLITPKQYTRYVRQYTCTLSDRSVGSIVYCIPKSLNLQKEAE
jgi:hypothetical protein